MGGVSHIHDETGSVKARHYEALKAAQTRHLAEMVKGGDERLIRRVIGGLSRARIALDGKLGMKQRKGAQVARL